MDSIRFANPTADFSSGLESSAICSQRPGGSGWMPNDVRRSKPAEPTRIDSSDRFLGGSQALLQAVRTAPTQTPTSNLAGFFRSVREFRSPSPSNRKLYFIGVVQFRDCRPRTSRSAFSSDGCGRPPMSSKNLKRAEGSRPRWLECLVAIRRWRIFQPLPTLESACDTSPDSRVVRTARSKNPRPRCRRPLTVSAVEAIFGNLDFYHSSTAFRHDFRDIRKNTDWKSTRRPR